MVFGGTGEGIGKYLFCSGNEIPLCLVFEFSIKYLITCLVCTNDFLHTLYHRVWFHILFARSDDLFVKDTVSTNCFMYRLLFLLFHVHVK